MQFERSVLFVNHVNQVVFQRLIDLLDGRSGDTVHAPPLVLHSNGHIPRVRQRYRCLVGISLCTPFRPVNHWNTPIGHFNHPHTPHRRTRGRRIDDDDL